MGGDEETLKDVVKTLKNEGYSERSIREILKWYRGPDLFKMTKTELVQAIVDRMDIATLWRWQEAIKRRQKREREERESKKDECTRAYEWLFGKI